MTTYEQLQTQRNEYQKQARIAKQKGHAEKVQKFNFEIKFLNKRLREMHKKYFYHS